MLLALFIGLAVHAKFRSLPAWLGSSMGFVANVSGVVVSVLIVMFNLQSVLRLYIAFSGMNLTVKASTNSSSPSGAGLLELLHSDVKGLN